MGCFLELVRSDQFPAHPSLEVLLKNWGPSAKRRG